MKSRSVKTRSIMSVSQFKFVVYRLYDATPKHKHGNKALNVVLRKYNLFPYKYLKVYKE